MAPLFVALLPPAAVRSELAGLPLDQAGMRITPIENFHLTLRFVGVVEETVEKAIEASLAKVVVEPFILPVGSLGVFPQIGAAKVIWAGIGNGHTRLFQLRKQVDEALLSVLPELDVQKFHPHFTLARLGENYDPKRLARLLAQNSGFEAPPFRVGEFHLMASDKRRGLVSTYRIVRTFPLKG